jgi:peptide-methionine (S)-S-oxide reductase
MSREKATFGAGCFWGVEAAFAALSGATATAVGYEGGRLERPGYEDACTDATGHAEVVELDFDPSKVSYEQLLDAFFTLHDPTTVNRQEPDRGTGVPISHFYHPPRQQSEAQAKIEQRIELGRFKPKPIVTEAEPAQTFWRAEQHQARRAPSPNSTTRSTWKSADRPAATSKLDFHSPQAREGPPFSRSSLQPVPACRGRRRSRRRMCRLSKLPAALPSRDRRSTR